MLAPMATTHEGLENSIPQRIVTLSQKFTNKFFQFFFYTLKKNKIWIYFIMIEKNEVKQKFTKW